MKGLRRRLASLLPGGADAENARTDTVLRSELQQQQQNELASPPVFGRRVSRPTSSATEQSSPQLSMQQQHEQPERLSPYEQALAAALQNPSRTSQQTASAEAPLSGITILPSVISLASPNHPSHLITPDSGPLDTWGQILTSGGMSFEDTACETAQDIQGTSGGFDLLRAPAAATAGRGTSEVMTLEASSSSGMGTLHTYGRPPAAAAAPAGSASVSTAAEIASSAANRPCNKPTSSSSSSSSSISGIRCSKTTANPASNLPGLGRAPTARGAGAAATAAGTAPAAAAATTAGAEAAGIVNSLQSKGNMRGVGVSNGSSSSGVVTDVTQRRGSRRSSFTSDGCPGSFEQSFALALAGSSAAGGGGGGLHPAFSKLHPEKYRGGSFSSAAAAAVVAHEAAQRRRRRHSSSAVVVGSGRGDLGEEIKGGGVGGGGGGRESGVGGFNRISEEGPGTVVHSRDGKKGVREGQDGEKEEVAVAIDGLAGAAQRVAGPLRPVAITWAGPMAKRTLPTYHTSSATVVSPRAVQNAVGTVDGAEVPAPGGAAALAITRSGSGGGSSSKSSSLSGRGGSLGSASSARTARSRRRSYARWGYDGDGSDGEGEENFYTGTSHLVSGDPYASDSSFDGFEGFSDGAITEETSTVGTSIYDSRTRADILGEAEGEKKVEGGGGGKVGDGEGGSGTKAKGKERGVMDSAGSIGRFRSKLGKLISGKIEGLVSGRGMGGEGVQSAVGAAAFEAEQQHQDERMVTEGGRNSGRAFDQPSVALISEASSFADPSMRSTSVSSNNSSGTWAMNSSNSSSSGSGAFLTLADEQVKGGFGSSAPKANAAAAAAATVSNVVGMVSPQHVRRGSKGVLPPQALSGTIPLDHISEGSASAGETPRTSWEAIEAPALNRPSAVVAPAPVVSSATTASRAVPTAAPPSRTSGSPFAAAVRSVPPGPARTAVTGTQPYTPPNWELPPFSAVYGPAAADRARADAAAFLAAAAAAATSPATQAPRPALMHQMHHPAPAAAASGGGGVQITMPPILMQGGGGGVQQLPVSLPAGIALQQVQQQQQQQVQVHGEESLAMLVRDTLQCIRDTEAFRWVLILWISTCHWFIIVCYYYFILVRDTLQCIRDIEAFRWVPYDYKF